MSKTSSPPRLRALIYNRASADKTGQRVSVESQDFENRAFCDRQGWEIVGTVTDNNRSASRFAARQREEYRRVAAALGGTSEFGRVDVLVIWESSRGERSLDGYVDLRDSLEANNVLYAYKGRIFNMQEGDDRFTTGLDALLDEREAERARDRTKRSHRASVNALRPRSFAPYGYTRTYAAGGRVDEQIPDPETSLVVRQIVARVLAGDTLYVVAQDLNRDGVLPPRAHRAERNGRPRDHAGWSPSIIRNLLSKPSLAGLRSYHGTVVGEATWDAIVDPADWARVQALLHAPNRPTARTRTALYLLSGVAECAVCGGWLRPLLNRGRMTYACAGVNPTAAKGHVSRGLDMLDAWVTGQVIGWLSNPASLRQLHRRPAGDGSETAEALHQIRGLEARLAEFEESAVAGVISPAAFGRIEQRLRGEIAGLQPRAELVVPPVVVEAAGPDAGQRWGALALPDRRLVLRCICRVVVSRASRPGVREFDPSTVEMRWLGQW